MVIHQLPSHTNLQFIDPIDEINLHAHFAYPIVHILGEDSLFGQLIVFNEALKQIKDREADSHQKLSGQLMVAADFPG
ncbi:hypothetical protein D3C75_439230 [compost metagenome]